MRVTFISMAFGGEAVARHEGKAIFVPVAMPGDEAEIEIVEDKGRFARGRMVKLIKPAPERITPRCKHFGVCGGCQWQHVPYPLQLEYKTQLVREQLTRIGGLSDPVVHPTIGADDPWHYRNHIQFHVDDEGRLGFMAAKSNQVIPIEECHILEPPVESLWRELELDLPELEEVALRAGINTGERMAALRLRGDEAPEAEIDLAVHCVVQLDDGSEIVLSGDDHFHESLGGQTLQVSADSFFQVHTPQAEKLVQLVRERVLAPTPGPSPVKRERGEAPNPSPPAPHYGGSPVTQGRGVILDAYCGVGTFALALAPFARKVIGIESAPSAVRDARLNAQGFPSVQIVEGTVEKVLPQLRESFDAIALDPPREGCAPVVLDTIAQRRIPRIVYVSCDPTTLARDVKRLTAASYHFVEAQPLDMFPQTFHIETVAVLDLR